MYKYILEQVGNINWMALFALLTFVFIFSMSTYLILRKDKETLSHLSNLPLSAEDQVL